MTAEKYDVEITKLRHELSVYRADSFLQQVLDHLHWSQTLEKPASGMPWICLFLLKLAMQESGEGGRDMATGEFGVLANKLFHMQHLACPIELGEVHLMLRPMILQQAWYQGDVVSDIRVMTRQMIWYFDEDAPYAKIFEASYGVPLKEFYLISLYLDIIVADNAKGIVGINLYEMIFFLTPTIPLKSIICYFLLVSVRSQDLPRFFRAHGIHGDLHQQSEYFQTTPLRKKPVLLDGDNLFIYNAKLFSRSAGMMVPDLFKKIPNWGFKDHFGPTMEKYLGSIFSASSITYLSESELNQCCRNSNVVGGKMADYLVPGALNIFFESKAIEPGDIVSSVFDPEILRAHLKGSFIKGIEQCQESVHRLHLTKEYAFSDFACVVITHEDFWFASADDVANFIDPDLGTRMGVKYGGIPVPFSNILFVTIDAVEHIFEAVSQGEIDLESFILDCIETLKTPEGKRFTMSHMIQDKLAGKLRGHSVVMQKADEWHQYFQSEMSKNKVAWQGRARELIQQRMVVVDVLHRQFNRCGTI